MAKKTTVVAEHTCDICGKDMNLADIAYEYKIKVSGNAIECADGGCYGVAVDNAAGSYDLCRNCFATIEGVVRKLNKGVGNNASL